MPNTTSANSKSLTGISSMATRQLLVELAAAYQQQTGIHLKVDSVGGVNASNRIQAGEAFDLVFLASDAIEALIKTGHVVPGSKVDLVTSGVAVAVRAGAELPDISSEAQLKTTVLATVSQEKAISYSTGPSGVALAKLFERWGITEQVAPHFIQAASGVPVGSLIAKGDVALGFQQLSELIHLDGISIVGPLPPAVQITTTFSAGVCSTSSNKAAANAVLAFMTSPAANEAKLRQGMELIT